MKFGIAEALGVLTGLGVAALLYIAIPERPFLTVHDLTVEDGEVYTTRSIDGGKDGKTIADWLVTIVGEGVEEPVCQTLQGKKLHEGWSIYENSPRYTKSFHIDVWVGDNGCWDRMKSGEYDMFVTWTPRDGRDPVAKKVHFTK